MDPNIAVSKIDGYVDLPNGHRKPVVTTRGWDAQVRWKDQSTNWIALTQLKESNPVKVAEAAIAHGVIHEPAFKWWAPSVMRKHDRIIKRLKAIRCQKGRMKFDILVPGTVEEAIKLEVANGNTL